MVQRVSGLIAVVLCAGGALRAQTQPMVFVDRWTAKAERPEASALEKRVYPLIRALDGCELQQAKVPGSPDVRFPAPGTTQVTEQLMGMGLQVVPLLAEALDDQRPTKTVPRSGNLQPQPAWTVGEVAYTLIREMCERDFRAEGQTPAQRTADLQKVILAWYAGHGNESAAQRKIGEVSEPWGPTRWNAIRWLGRTQTVAGRAALEKDLDRLLAERLQNPQQSREDKMELAECSLALGQLGDKASLARVQAARKALAEIWDRDTRPRGYDDLRNLYVAYQGEALLGDKAEVAKRMEAVLENLPDVEVSARDAAARWLKEVREQKE